MVNRKQNRILKICHMDKLSVETQLCQINDLEVANCELKQKLQGF